jgi:hypothetical protein
MGGYGMHRGIILMVFSLVWAPAFIGAQDAPQFNSTPDGPPPHSAVTATGLTPDDIVISIGGFCDHDLLIDGTPISALLGAEPSKSDTARQLTAGGAVSTGTSGDHKPADCKTEVTRAQFEKLIDTLSPGADPSSRIRAAVRYPETLVFAQKALELGLDKSPGFEIELKYYYLQVLSQRANRYLAQKANDISDAEVEEYYKEHPETFQQVDLRRIFVPNERKHLDIPSSPAKIEQMRAADEAAMKAEAKEIRRKAAAGGDFATLAAEAYKFAGNAADEAPDIDVGEVNRAEVPEEYQKAVFDLRPGQVSEVIDAPRGWHICKVVSRQTIPLNQAKLLLVRIRLRDLTNSVKSSIDPHFNDAYFNTPHGMEPAKSFPKGTN